MQKPTNKIVILMDENGRISVDASVHMTDAQKDRISDFLVVSQASWLLRFMIILETFLHFFSFVFQGIFGKEKK